MGHLTVCNPAAQLYSKLPYIALHAMEHGSFSYRGDVHGKGRVDIKLLLDTLQKPGPGHALPVPDDGDRDGLSDSEEAFLGTNPTVSDTCGEHVNMGYVEVVNPRSPLRITIPYLALHHMRNGSFSYCGDTGSVDDRVDPCLLQSILRSGVVIARGEAGVDLRWTGLPGKRYQVFTAVELSGPWTPGTVFQGDGTELVFADDMADGTPRKFYKIHSW